MKRMVALLMMLGLLVSVGCGGDGDSSPTSSSVSKDKYSETIVGTWNAGGEPILTFNADKTVIYDAFETIYTWSISGSILTVSDPMLVRSNRDHLGEMTWVDEDGDERTYYSNGTFVDWGVAGCCTELPSDGAREGTWSLNKEEDQLTMEYNDAAYDSEFYTNISFPYVGGNRPMREFTFTNEGDTYVWTRTPSWSLNHRIAVGIAEEVFARYEITSLSNKELIWTEEAYHYFHKNGSHLGSGEDGMNAWYRAGLFGRGSVESEFPDVKITLTR